MVYDATLDFNSCGFSNVGFINTHGCKESLWVSWNNSIFCSILFMTQNFMLLKIQDKFRNDWLVGLVYKNLVLNLHMATKNEIKSEISCYSNPIILIGDFN